MKISFTSFSEPTKADALLLPPFTASSCIRYTKISLLQLSSHHWLHRGAGHGKRKPLSDLPWKDKRWPLSIRWPLELFQWLKHIIMGFSKHTDITLNWNELHLSSLECYQVERWVTLTPVNMPDPIQKHFGYDQLWPLRPACSQNQAGSYMLDPTSTSFLVPFFQRRHGSYCTKLTRIRSGWPGQGLAKHIWSGSKLVCRNHPAWFLAGHNLPATSFPFSYLVAFFHRHPG